MSQASDQLESDIITHQFRTGTWAKPTVVAIALCTSLPTDSQTGATIPEVANANAYARVLINPLDANWAVPGAGGLTSNSVVIAFPEATGRMLALGAGAAAIAVTTAGAATLALAASGSVFIALTCAAAAFMIGSLAGGCTVTIAASADPPPLWPMVYRGGGWYW